MTTDTINSRSVIKFKGRLPIDLSDDSIVAMKSDNEGIFHLHRIYDKLPRVEELGDAIPFTGRYAKEIFAY